MQKAQVNSKWSPTVAVWPAGDVVAMEEDGTTLQCARPNDGRNYVLTERNLIVSNSVRVGN